MYPNSRALVVSTENITQNWYFGNNRAMLIPNCLFRVGGAAMLMSNRRADRRRSKCACSGRLGLVLTLTGLGVLVLTSCHAHQGAWFWGGTSSFSTGRVLGVVRVCFVTMHQWQDPVHSVLQTGPLL